MDCGLLHPSTLPRTTPDCMERTPLFTRTDGLLLLAAILIGIVLGLLPFLAGWYAVASV